MVVFMDIAAQGNGGTGRISSDYSCEDTKDVVASVVENLPFSIPRSRIFYYHDFSCTKIAFGFYGDVFKVEHRRTKQVMVLKMSRPGRESEDCTIMEEIKLMNRLSHQNVIRFLGICLEESRVHLLCEYINGGNLEEVLMNHSVALEWSARLYLAKDIANGMEYLHNEGVIHRDLTSKNCLVKARNGWRYAIVADLGLATEMNAQSIVGSPYNMAPELLRGEAYDEKADVFSYGIILCEIIGRVQADPDELPRTGEFGLDVEKFRHMIGDCPHEFLLAALWCCQMEPSTRPTFGETVRHLEFLLVGSQRRPELDDVTTEETVPETTPSAPRTDKPQINDVHENNNTGATATPSIVISTETSPRGSGTTEKRRQSWYAGRHKLFNTATEDLLRNTPGKLKNFFHRVLRVHTHFDPTKHKKQKDSGKGRSVSELRRFSLLDSVENCHKLTPGSDPLSASASLSYPNSPVTNTDRIPHRSLSDLRLSSEFGSEGDSIDGRSATRKYRSSSALSRSFNSSRQPPKSPNMLEATTSCPNSRHASESDTPVSSLLNQSRKARCKSMPTFDESKPDRLARRAGSHRLCEVNSDHATGDDGIDTSAKLKHKKSPFKIFRRKSTSKHKDADVDKS